MLKISTQQLERIVDNYEEYKDNGQAMQYLQAISYKIKLNTENKVNENAENEEEE